MSEASFASSAQGEGEIEDGAADGALRLWAAKEAVRQAELRLAAQTANLAAMETRAMTMLGWISAMALAVAGAAVTRPTVILLYTGVVIIAALIISAGNCIWALWPRSWHSAGIDPEWVVKEGAASDSPTEWTIMEAMADSYATGIRRNDERLEAFGSRLRWAWAALMGVPSIAVIALAVEVFRQTA